MNISKNSKLLDHLAMAYALGTLRGHARLRLEAIAREQPTVRAAMLSWQTQLASLNELQRPAIPSDAVWWRINQQVTALLEREQAKAGSRPSTLSSAGSTSSTPTSSSPKSSSPKSSISTPGGQSWWQNLKLWQGAALAFAIATVAIGLSRQQLETVLTEKLASTNRELEAAKNAPPTVKYVAVLLDQKAAEAILVTVDPQRSKVAVKRVGNFKEADDKSLQLWALGDNAKPRSLGVLSAQELEQVLANLINPELASALAVSLEPKGGVPEAGGPTGPVLFKGALIKTAM
jgi:anti-sigma-K factor RskA